MKGESADKLERLFQASQILPPHARPAFLDAACGEDHVLRAECESLLAADARAEAERFLDDLAKDLTMTPEPLRVRSYSQGTSIGPYVVQRKLGSGGMGDVYLGVQEEPFRRFVVLKDLDPGGARPKR